MLKGNSRYFRILVLMLLILSLAGLYPARFGFTQNNQAEQFRAASKAFSDAYYDAALSLFERFIKEFPDSHLVWQARLYLAKCYYYKQDYQQVLRTLNEMVNRPQALNLAAEIHYESNNPNAAAKAFSDIASGANDSQLVNTAYLELFRIYFFEKDYSKIVSLGEVYLEKFKSRPEAARVYFYLGKAYYVQREWNKAKESYQEALAANPDTELMDLVYQGLGFSYIGEGNVLKAKAAIDKIRGKELRLSSQGAYYFKIKDYLQALETLNMFIRDYPKSSFLADAYLNKADVLYNLGRLNDAVYTYKYVLGNFSASANTYIINKAHYGLARSYLKKGRFKEAIDEFKNTLEYAENTVVKVSSQIHIADAYQEIGRFQEALDAYNDVLKNYPNTIYADYIQLQIGLTFLKNKDLEKSFLTLKSLQNSFPSSQLISQAQYYLAVGYFSSGDYSQARSLLEDFIAKFGQDELIVKALYLYGRCFFNEKDYQRAIEVFKEIIGKSSDRQIKELAYIDIGTAYLNLSESEQAKRIWTSFLREYPQSQHWASVALYLGRLYEKEENFAEAQKYYRWVAAEKKDSLWGYEALLALGHLYWNNGDLEKAEEYFKTLAKEPTSLTAKSKLYLARILVQKQEYGAALNVYDELAGGDEPLAGIACFEKALIFKEQGRYSEANEMFKRAIDLGVDSQKLRFSFGRCLEKTALLKEAVEQYFKVIYNFGSNDPQIVTAEDKDYRDKSFFRIARIYEKENKLTEAKRIYQRIISLGAEESKVAEIRLKELKDKLGNGERKCLNSSGQSRRR